MTQNLYDGTTRCSDTSDSREPRHCHSCHSTQLDQRKRDDRVTQGRVDTAAEGGTTRSDVSVD